MPIYEPEQTSFADERHTNVLWGRVVALAVVLLLVFLLGRASAGDGSSEQVEDLQARLASAQAEIEQLDRQVRAQSTATTVPAAGLDDGTTGTTLPTTGASPGTAGGAATTTRPGTAGATTTTTATEDEMYTVRSGDSLRSIASRFYGNARLESCIAKAQNPPITDASRLQIGQKLVIPRPNPTAPC